ncbi:cyclin-like protein [Hypoxylon sp. FL1150]|nr:cyclin-like protein [Hypoxylon sp. FL1150]
MAHMSNPLATVEQLYQRTSFSALPSDLQDIIYYEAQRLTQAAGILLRIPQSVTAQANVVLARFWLAESPLSYEFSDTSAAALFLAAKLSAHPCTPRDVCNVYAYLLSSASPFLKGESLEADGKEKWDPSSYYLSENAYTLLRERILSLEARVLYTLSFDTHVALPHPLAITYLQALDFLDFPKKDISRRTVAYLNSALLSPQLLYLTHQPNALAVAAVYNAAKDVGAKMPECAWWEVFDVDREELGFLVVGLRSLEGWARKQSENYSDCGPGMVTRNWIYDEMRKRGLQIGNGNSIDVHMEDEEAAMMRRMDEKEEELE